MYRTKPKWYYVIIYIENHSKHHKHKTTRTKIPVKANNSKGNVNFLVIFFRPPRILFMNNLRQMNVFIVFLVGNKHALMVVKQKCSINYCSCNRKQEIIYLPAAKSNLILESKERGRGREKNRFWKKKKQTRQTVSERKRQRQRERK